MNRSITLVGAAILLAGFALIASPIVLTGAEQFDLEQEGGIFLLPPALVVVLIGAVSHNPERTTVGGTFGNPDVTSRRPAPLRAAETPRIPLGYNPREPVDCRYCHTLVASELVQCPRCGRARDCRTCGRPLGMVLDRATCPRCGRVEVFCNCPRMAWPSGARGVDARVRRR